MGRHLKNGEITLQGEALQQGLALRGWEVFRTNFYSYTNPDFPFLNHHWGSGVIFFLVNKFLGFTGLSVFFVCISILTFWLFFDTARRNSPFGITLLTSLVLLPVIAYRKEIRPEMFSYLFCGLFLWTLWRTGRLNRKQLLVLPLLQLLWVNLHVYFFLGPFIIGIFLMEKVIKGHIKENMSLGVIFLLSLLICAVNPAGIQGVLQPLRIFTNYGYRVLENQTVFFIDKVLGNYVPNLYFKIGFGLLAVSWLAALWKNRLSLINLVLAVFISYLGWTAIRNFTIFGYFAIPIITANFSLVRPRLLRLNFDEDIRIKFFVFSSAFLILFGIFALNTRYWMGKKIGLGLEKGVDNAAGFFKQNNLKGPVFNNYDIGGYLIYYLYPQEKVFVDNRPEAYPSGFFTDIYVPMQEQMDKWEQNDKKYGFNAIFFYRRDLTPWAQTFLVSRIADKNWAPVFVDDFNIIFLKRNEKNKELTKKFELPKEMFSVRK